VEINITRANKQKLIKRRRQTSREVAIIHQKEEANIKGGNKYELIRRKR
jgi:hypothetical protein